MSTDIIVVKDRQFTIAFGIYFDSRFEGGGIAYAGATRKNPKDHDNPERGERLAVGNAFRNLGRQILKEEYNKIHTQFNVSRRPAKITKKVEE
jgi:hypothetical protein